MLQRQISVFPDSNVVKLNLSTTINSDAGCHVSCTSAWHLQHVKNFSLAIDFFSIFKMTTDNFTKLLCSENGKFPYSMRA